MALNYTVAFNISYQEDEFGFFTTTARYVKFFVILLMSLLIIVSNTINITILRLTKQIPMVSRMFLINLGIADLCTGVVVCLPCIVPALTSRWPYGLIWCQVASVIYCACATISVWSIALVSLERYLAVVHPLTFKNSLSPRRCGRVLVVLWTAAIIIYLSPILSKPNFIYYQFYPANVMCGFYWEYAWFCYATGFIIPQMSGACIIFCTIKTIQTLKKTHPSSNGAMVGDNSGAPRTQREEKAVRMVTLTALSYFSMWVPYCVVCIIVVSDQNASSYIAPWTEFVTTWMANANSFINVFIYSGIYPSFRQKLIETLCCCKHKPNEVSASIPSSRNTDMTS